MARKQFSVADLLYLGNAPKTQDALEDSPRIRSTTGGRKARTKGKRDLSVRIPKQATISAPKRGATQAVYDAINRYTPALSPAVQAFEGLTGLRETEDALSRGFRQAVSGEGYLQAPELQSEDAMLLGLTAAGGPVLKGLGKVGGAIGRVLPENMLGRAKDYLTEGRALFDKDFIDSPFNVIANQPAAQRALPAPPKQLALPAPGPGLPSFAAKPRGGQWYVDKDITGANFSPESAARFAVPAGLLFSSNPQDVALRQWWEKAVPKYLKTDFASPNDPLRDLAERGLLHIPDKTPDEWSKMAGENFISDPIQDILFGGPTKPGAMPGAGSDLRGEVMTAMPWLAKQPVTDNLYGVSSTSLGALQFPHVADELRNAMNAEANNIPLDLAVRPEALQRMSFPQAVERVGRINQFRAKQMEEAGLSSFNSPAVHTFKEYTDDNPMGLRWVELAPPKNIDKPQGYDAYFDEAEEMYVVTDPEGRRIGLAHNSDDINDLMYQDAEARILQEALDYEGNTMGHCVGGYCDDVMGGSTRIFSLRDAKGEPHVTVETQPSSKSTAAADHLRNLGVLEDWQNYWKSYPRAAMKKDEDIHDVTQQFLAARGLPPVDYSAENIVQIKGKQNRAPKDDYLPFVQDFVKSQQWGNIGDFGNTGLVKLPDGRYITAQQAEEGIAKIPSEAVIDPTTMHYLPPEMWKEYEPYFEGYAIGGRVERGQVDCGRKTW